MPLADALARATELAAQWDAAPRWNATDREAFLAKAGYDPHELVRVLEALSRACLAETDRESAPCKALVDPQTPEGKVLEPVLELLAEVDAPGTGATRFVTALVRLQARGVWRAEMSLERILERRLTSAKLACTAPSQEQVAAAEADLQDFYVRSIKGGVRPMSSVERADLAYFVASVGKASPWIGSVETTTASPLAEGHEDLAKRAALREKLEGALREGKIEDHAKLALEYLGTLGYPGPIREAEERDMRWGGAGYSFVMRDLARSLEILGRFAEAEVMYRKPKPGGGGCGTSVHTRRDEQIEGAIRTGELARGCGATVAERLFAVDLDLNDTYGPEHLATRGFDVPRLYRGALATLGRSDEAALRDALRSSSYATTAEARLARMGAESWASRVRAIEGYADAAGGASLDVLLVVAASGTEDERVTAIDVIGRMVEDRGWDPCAPGVGIGWGRSGGGRRDVRTLMTKCETKVDAKTLEKVATDLAAMHADPSPRVRAAIAEALGYIARPKSEATLRKLASDKYDNGGQVCTSKGNGPSVCEKNRPVAIKARKGLEDLAAAQKRRKEQKQATKQ